MKEYKISVSSYQNHGIIYAPTLTEEAVSENDAIKQAKQKSGLGRFDKWDFKVIK